MKILAIRGCNLASIDGEFEIDFTQEPLKSAGLFAITGHTGAGKSTILDALCLALYDKTPRTEQKVQSVNTDEIGGVQQDDPRLILRKGTGSGWAEVDFRAINGSTYRSRWSVNRAYGKPGGKLQPIEISVDNLTTKSRLSGNKTELLVQLADLIGLSYNQFVQSVLLAQNDFASFMKAVDNEKAKILEKITGIDIYAKISKRIYERSKEAEADLNRIKDQLQGIEILKDEELELIRTEQNRLAVEIEALDKKNELHKSKLNWWETLSALQHSKKDAELQLEQAKTTNEAALPRREYMKMRVKAKEIAPDFRQWKDGVKELHDKQLSLKELTIKETSSKAEFEKWNQELTVKKERLNDAKNKQSELKPLITKARQLDSEVRLAHQQLKIERETLDSHNNNLSNIVKNIDTLNRQSSEIENKQNTINQWIANNSIHEPMIKESGKIKTLLAQLGKNLKDIEKQNTEIEKNKTSKTLKDNELKNAVIISEKLKKEENDIRLQINEIKENLGKVNINQHKDQLKHYHTHIELLNQAYVAFEKMQESKTAIKQANDREESEKSKQAQLTIKLSEANEALAAAQKNYSEEEKAFESIKHAADTMVEGLRATLKDNSPCPVCGSKEHNFEAVSNDVVNAHKKRYEAAKAQLDISNKNVITLNEQTKTTVETLKQLEKELNNLNIKNETLLKEWHNIDLQLNKQSEGAKFNDISDITNEKSRINTLVQKAEDDEKSYNKLQQQLQEKQQLADQIETKIRATGETLKQLETEIKGLNVKIESDTNLLQDTAKAANTITNECNRLITISQWIEKWHSNQDGFVAMIENLAAEWNKADNDLQKLNQDIEGVRGQLKSNQQQHNELNLHTENISKKYLKAQDDHQKVKSERELVLQGRDADIVEKEIGDAIQKLATDIETVQQKQQKIKSDLDKLEATLDSMRDDIAQKEANTEKHNIITIDWCEAQNPPITIEQLTELLAKDMAWEEREQQELDAISAAVEKGETIVKERSAKIDEHHTLPSKPHHEDETIETLKVAIAEATSEKDGKTNLKAENSAKLSNNEKNIIKFADIKANLDKQQKTTDNWLQLNKILGSADGDTFRKIAQGYTLDYLLINANTHLDQLSSRYKLERIGDSLSLQVKDSYMCDERRSVLSLSGGESFLISLALALGLSSLASDRINVESLFIDEGFGSLDIETLRVAMEALTTLQTQGRKIGVISHVQEMTESIAVRVNVEKNGQGSSKVRISSH